jgi:hypothetical protein
VTSACRSCLASPCSNENHGPMCWELDAMSPPVLRRRVEAAIRRLINVEAWEHCRMVEEAERESLKRFKWA